MCSIDKVKSYEQPFINNPIEFVPFIFESSVRVGPKAVHAIMCLCTSTDSYVSSQLFDFG